MFGQNGKRNEDFQFVCSSTKSSIEFKLAPSSLLRKLAPMSGCRRSGSGRKGAHSMQRSLCKNINSKLFFLSDAGVSYLV